MLFPAPVAGHFSLTSGRASLKLQVCRPYSAARPYVEVPMVRWFRWRRVVPDARASVRILAGW